MKNIKKKKIFRLIKILTKIELSLIIVKYFCHTIEFFLEDLVKKYPETLLISEKTYF